MSFSHWRGDSKIDLARSFLGTDALAEVKRTATLGDREITLPSSRHSLSVGPETPPCNGERNQLVKDPSSD